MSPRGAVTVYTDGSCLGNPGPGGFAAVLLSGRHRRELSGGYADTTNNRMELMGVIEALAALKRPCDVTLYTDSSYIKNAVTRDWLGNWRRNGWRTADKKPVKNRDLWERLSTLLTRHAVSFRFVRGHSGDPENERCDELASAAASSRRLKPDRRG